MDDTQQDPGFVADLKAAFAVWSGNPLVPLVYLGLGVAVALLLLAVKQPPHDCAVKRFGACPADPSDTARNAGLGFLVLPFYVAQIGLAGASRLWYVRRFDGERMTFAELWSYTWRYWPRFALLGLLLLAVELPFGLAAVVLLFSSTSLAPSLVTSAVGALLADVLFTFATPGLALYNGNAWESLRGSVLMIRRTWPACAAYALLPPLALLLLSRTAGREIGGPVTALFALLAFPLGLLASGAAVRFMLRRYPAPQREGSLTPRHRDPWSPPPAWNAPAT